MTPIPRIAIDEVTRLARAVLAGRLSTADLKAFALAGSLAADEALLMLDHGSVEAVEQR